MPDSPNRQAVRDGFASLLSAELGPEGEKAVVAVYPYSTVDILNQSPVILVFSDGTDRAGRQGFGDNSKFTTFVRLRVQAYVALPGKEDAGYTQRRAEDILDLLDKRIADIVTANNSHDKWRSLNYVEGFSTPEDVLMSGSPYMREEWQIVAGLPY
jgi:hypothetical protein